MDAVDYDSSTVFSGSVEGGPSGDVSQMDETSLSPSRNTLSETDITGRSYLDDNQPTYDDDYTSGYETKTYFSRSFYTRTYDDSSFPRSPRSDELSSTFASFYFGGERTRKLTSTISFLRMPLLFFSVVLSGSGSIGALCRVVHAVTEAAARRRGAARQLVADNVHLLPSGYPCLPSWMQQARLALPSTVESVVKRVLYRYGVPALADLQKKRWAEVLKGLKSGKEEIVSQATRVTSGPMVPLVIFLPVFSFAVISLARGMVARQEARRSEEEEEREIERLEAEAARRMRLFRDSEVSAIAEAEMSVVSGDVPIENEREYVLGPRKKEEGKPNNTGTLGSHMGEIPRLPLGAHLLADNLTSPQTVPTSRDLSPISSIQDDVSRPMWNSGINGTESSSLLGLSALQGLRVAQYALQGEVVAVLAGRPSESDVSVFLVAAVRYGCSRLILPLSVPESLLVSVPLPIPTERVDDVMQRVMSEESRGLTTVGVFLRRITEDTTELSQFTHPRSAVYVFVPAMTDNEDLIPHLVETRVFSTSSLDEPIPINACFYDRLIKERRAAAEGQNESDGAA